MVTELTALHSWERREGKEKIQGGERQREREKRKEEGGGGLEVKKRLYYCF